MKSFKKFIKEASGFPTGPVGENPSNVGGTVDVNPTEVGNPAVLKRLNAIVGQIGNGEYLVAEHAIEKLRATLTKIGLSMPPTPTMEGTSGSFEALSNHAPLLSSLEKGSIVVRTDGGEEKFEVSGGIVEVLNNKVVVLA